MKVGQIHCNFLVLFAYLEKYRFRKFVDSRQNHVPHEQWRTGGWNEDEMQRRLKALFISEHEVGSDEWCLDIRTYVPDQANSLQELLPPPQHIIKQAN